MVTGRTRWGSPDQVCLPPGSVAQAIDAVLSRVAAAAEAGVDIVYLREPDLPVARLFDLTAACVALTRRTDTFVVVNDRVDVALAAGADGVHLRSDSFSAQEARFLAPPAFIVGRSVHRPDELASERVATVDYLIAGTVFPTRSKPPDHALLGLNGLAHLVHSAAIPVLAIGGVRLDLVGAVAATGAAGLAAIDLFGGPPATMTALVGEIGAAFRNDPAAKARGSDGSC